MKTGHESSRTNRHHFPYFLAVPVLVGKIRNQVGNGSKVTGTGTGSVFQFSRPFFRFPACYSGIPRFSRFPSRQQTADKYAGPQSSLYLTSVCSSEWMGEVGLNSVALLVHYSAASLLVVGQGLLLSCACMHARGPWPASGSLEIHRSSLGHSFHFLFSFAVSLFCCSVPLH